MWLKVLLAAVFLVFFVAIYVTLMFANKNTEVPESSKERYKEAQGCTSCGSLSKFTVPKDVIDKFKEENL